MRSNVKISVPDSLLAYLKERAERNFRELDKEILSILDAAMRRDSKPVVAAPAAASPPSPVAAPVVTGEDDIARKYAELAAKQRNRVGKVGYRGVTAFRGKFRAQLFNQKTKRMVFLGDFATPEAAAETWDREARRVYGEEALVNFPKTSAEALHMEMFGDTDADTPGDVDFSTAQANLRGEDDADPEPR